MVSTTASRGNWIRVSRGSPCPVCDGADNCSTAADGSAAWCGRVSDGSLRTNAGGQYLHRLDADRPAPRRPVPRPARPAAETVDPARLRETWRLWSRSPQLAARIDELARMLAVSTDALFALGTVYVPSRDCWGMPERDAARNIVGVNYRSRTGEKRRGKGHRAGLTYCDGWESFPGPVHVVEGATDTAAGLDLGLCVVGRPSNAAGAEMLAALVRPLPVNRSIVVMGERDAKPDGRWPGRDGAVAVAARLRAMLPGRLIRRGLPPDGIKDVREWAILSTEGGRDE